MPAVVATRRVAGDAELFDLAVERRDPLGHRDERRRGRDRRHVPADPPGGLGLADLSGERLGDGQQRRVPHGAEPLVALLGGEVPRPEDGSVLVPGGHERVDHAPGGGAGPGFGDEPGDGCEVLGDLVGEGEDGILDVAEVLVEGRRRRPDLAGDVDDPQVPHPGGLEQPPGGVEQPVAGSLPTPAEGPAVGGDRRRAHPNAPAWRSSRGSVGVVAEHLPDHLVGVLTDGRGPGRRWRRRHRRP